MSDDKICPNCEHVQEKTYGNNKHSNVIKCSKCGYTWVALQKVNIKESGISVIMDSINHYNFTMENSNKDNFLFPFYVLNNKFIKTDAVLNKSNNILKKNNESYIANVSKSIQPYNKSKIKLQTNNFKSSNGAPMGWGKNTDSKDYKSISGSYEPKNSSYEVNKKQNPNINKSDELKKSGIEINQKINRAIDTLTKELGEKHLDKNNVPDDELLKIKQNIARQREYFEKSQNIKNHTNDVINIKNHTNQGNGTTNTQAGSFEKNNGIMQSQIDSSPIVPMPDVAKHNKDTIVLNNGKNDTMQNNLGGNVYKENKADIANDLSKKTLERPTENGINQEIKNLKDVFSHGGANGNIDNTQPHDKIFHTNSFGEFTHDIGDTVAKEQIKNKTYDEIFKFNPQFKQEETIKNIKDEIFEQDYGTNDSNIKSNGNSVSDLYNLITSKGGIFSEDAQEPYVEKFTLKTPYKKEALDAYKEVKESDFEVSPEDIIDEASLLSIRNRLNAKHLSNKLQKDVGVVLNSTQSNVNKQKADDFVFMKTQDLANNKNTNMEPSAYNLFPDKIYKTKEDLDDFSAINNWIDELSVLPQNDFMKDNSQNDFVNDMAKKLYTDYSDAVHEVKSQFFSLNNTKKVFTLLFYGFLVVVVILGFTNFNYEDQKQKLGLYEKGLIKSVPVIDAKEALLNEKYYVENNTKLQTNLDNGLNLENEDNIIDTTKQLPQDYNEEKEKVIVDQDSFLDRVLKNHTEDDFSPLKTQSNPNSAFSMGDFLNKKLLAFNSFKTNLVNDIKVTDVKLSVVKDILSSYIQVELKVSNSSSFVRKTLNTLDLTFINSEGKTVDKRKMTVFQPLSPKETILLKIKFVDLPLSVNQLYVIAQ